MIIKEVRKNKVKTGIIVIGFFIFIAVLVYFLSLLFFSKPYIAVAIALAFASVSALISYYNSDKMVLKLSNAREATREEYLQLNDSLDSLCIGAGLPRPKLYVMDTPALNAFATGRNPKNAVVCVTTGLLNTLDKYELEGVLGHELSHIKNYDILLSTVAIIMVGFVSIIADICMRGLLWGSGDRDRGGIILLIIGLAFIILSPICASLLQLAISRNREYLADASSVQITRNNAGLISALNKLENQSTSMEVNKATESLYIVNPLKNKKRDSLFSTHPTTANRIERLQNIK